MALPRIGLQAVFIVRDFRRGVREYTQLSNQLKSVTGRTAQEITSQTKRLATSFKEFEESSRVMQRAATEWPKVSHLDLVQQMGEAWNTLGKNAKVNVDIFDDLALKGVRTDEALRQAAEGVEEADKSLVGFAAAATAVSVALGVSVKAVRDSIRDYTDFAARVKQIRLELGASAEEASGWARAAELAGVSSTTFDRAITSLQKKMVDYRLKTLAGEEVSNNFTRAMNALDGSILKNIDTVQDANELLSILQDRFGDLGPGIITTGLAQDIFGFSGRHLLSILLDEDKAIADLTERARELGAVLTEKDEAATRELTVAQNESKLAMEGIKNFIARQYIPVLIDFHRGVVLVANAWRIFVTQGNAAIRTLIALKSRTIGILDAVGFYQDKVQELLGVENEAARAEEALAQARADAAQAALIAAEAEDQLLAKRQEVLDQMSELEVDFNQRMEDVAIRFNRRWEDIIADRFADQIRRTIQFANRVQELSIRHQQKLEDIARKEVNKQRDVRDDLNKKLERFDEDARRRREKLESAHQLRLFRIQTRFLDTVQDAARRNDAVAVVQAIRRRQRDLRDETQRHRVDQSNLAKDLRDRRKRIEDDAKDRAEDAKQDFDDQRKRADIEFKRQLEALRRKNDQENTLLQLKYDKQRVDFERDRRRAEADVRRWYDRERQALQAQLDQLGTTVSSGVQQMGVTIARSVSEAVTMIGGAAGAAVGRATVQIIGAASGIIGRVSEDQMRIININRRRRVSRPGQTFRRGDGGVDIVNRPTSFQMGDKGGEVHAFIPLRHMTTVRHQFGNMGVDFNGLPGGMNTSQVEAIVYNVMVKVAEQLEGSI